jgi:hypothetical protein
VKIVNQGNTPAYKVRITAKADVVQFPIPETFTFDITDPLQDRPGSIIASAMHKIVSSIVPGRYDTEEIEKIKIGAERRIIMWGKITYEDAFQIPRFVKFGFTFYWFDDRRTVMSSDTERNNESN